jgi:hypothetical protein
VGGLEVGGGSSDLCRPLEQRWEWFKDTDHPCSIACLPDSLGPSIVKTKKMQDATRLPLYQI